MPASTDSLLGASIRQEAPPTETGCRVCRQANRQSNDEDDAGDRERRNPDEIEIDPSAAKP